MFYDNSKYDAFVFFIISNASSSTNCNEIYLGISITYCPINHCLLTSIPRFFIVVTPELNNHTATNI